MNNKDGQTFNRTTGQDRGLEHNVAGRAKLHYMGSESFDAVLSVSFSESSNDANQLNPGTSGTVPADRAVHVRRRGARLRPERRGDQQRGAAPAAPEQPAQRQDQQTIATANLAWEFDAFTLRSITGFVKTDDYFTTDFSGRGTLFGASDPVAEQTSQELQIQGTAFDDRLNYLAGLYYLKERGRGFSAGTCPCSAAPRRRARSSRGRSRSRCSARRISRSPTR